MKENDVAALASLLNKKPEDVSAALEGDGISGLIDEFKTGHEIFTSTELDSLKTNLQNSFDAELVNRKELPKPVYDRIKGGVLEMTEKELAGKFGIDSYNGVTDLVNKIVESKAKSPKDVAELKAQIDQLVEDHARELDEVKSTNNNRFKSLRLKEFVDSVPIDAEGALLENQREILRTMIESKFKFDIADDSLVIAESPVEHLQKNLDPRPIPEVFNEFAKLYVNVKSPNSGGRGDSSSASSSGMKSVNLKDHMQKHGIRPNSLELYEFVEKCKTEGIEIIE